MRASKKASIALSIVGTWSLVFGLQNCAVVLDHGGRDDASANICDELATQVRGVSSMVCSESEEEEVLRDLGIMCSGRGGYEASCSVRPSSESASKKDAVAARVVSYDTSAMTLINKWQLNPMTVDTTKPLTVSFRFKSEDPVTFDVNGVQVWVGSTHGRLCTSPSVTIPSLSKPSFEIELTAAGISSSDSLVVDGIYVSYAPIAEQNSDPVVAFGACSGSTSLSDHCEKNSQECYCLQERDDRNWLAVIPLVALMISVPIQCWFVRRWRRRLIREDWEENELGYDADHSRPHQQTKNVPHIQPIKVDLDWSEEPQQNSPGSGRSLPRQLHDVLRDPDSQLAFRQFLQRKNAAEYLLFYESVALYEDSIDRQWRKEEAGKMIHRFVKNDAPYRINLQHSTQQQLMQATHFPQDLFAAAKMEVYDLMQIQFLGAFLQTAQALSPRGSPIQWKSFGSLEAESSDDDGNSQQANRGNQHMTLV